MGILKKTYNQFTNGIIYWLNFSWLEDAGYVPCMDIAMPPLEIGFIYLELSDDIDSFYSSSKHK